MDWLEISMPPVLVAFGAIVTWFIKSKREELLAVEKRLHDERRSVYLKFLDPYIILFTNPTKENIDKAITKITSYDYRKGFKWLNIIGKATN